MSLIIPRGIEGSSGFPLSDIPEAGVPTLALMLCNRSLRDTFRTPNTKACIELLRPRVGEIFSPDTTERILGGWGIFNALYGLSTGRPLEISFETRCKLASMPPDKIAGLIEEGAGRLSLGFPNTVSIVREVSEGQHPGSAPPYIGGTAIARELYVEEILGDLDSQL